MSAQILLVEDEKDIRDLIVLHLKRDGYAVEPLSEGPEALKKIRESKYDLMIFDWMLPGVSGLELVKAARPTGGPILMVTARTEPADIVLGLECGADDYITKPFEVPVLLARVRALLRRGRAGTAPTAGSLIKSEGLTIDKDAHEVRVDGQVVPFTVSEFKLLVALFQNPGKVLTRGQLVEMVQGTGVNVVDRTIDTHVFGIRKKLGTQGDLIETIRGVGYRVK